MDLQNLFKKKKIERIKKNLHYLSRILGYLGNFAIF